MQLEGIKMLRSSSFGQNDKEKRYFGNIGIF
jgi:hypothetical protein